MSTATHINVASHLAEMAHAQPKTLAVACPIVSHRRKGVIYDQWNYRRLNEETDRLAWGLERIGIRRGVRTVLMVRPSLEFFALTFALFKVGAVAVLIDPGMGIKSLTQCLKEAEPEAFIGIGKAQVARLLFGWGKGTLKTIVTVGRRWYWGGLTLDEVRNAGGPYAEYLSVDVQSDEMAAILFTSGSTGPPKGAVYTHGNFSAQVDILRETFGIRPGEIDLPTFPLFALFAPALGMSAIIPDMDFTRPGQVDPRKIIDPINRFSVTTMFASPALLDRVGSYGVKNGAHLPSLCRVISAGAPVRAEVLQTFTTLLRPDTQVFTPYGATEALPVCSIGSKEILTDTATKSAEGAGVCVGRSVKNMSVKVIQVRDEPIETWRDDLLVSSGTIGELVVQGPVVTRSYFNRPESTQLAKIAESNGVGFFHRMGDLGYFDDRGRLWFCGRKTHRVVTPKETLFTIPCESIFNQHPKVRRTALVGVGEPGHANPVLCVEIKKEEKGVNREALKAELLTLGGKHSLTAMIRTILFHPSFPVDIRHNAKIFREKLAVWAARQLP
ncbi:MAG TPA: fatty acid CoA ligase family protein [Gemmataceae bacterium]|nr:fatty acid CoA ligase family protein [Gemmataceae bacterium]